MLNFEIVPTAEIGFYQIQREDGEITNAELQELFGVSKATATRDLTELVEKYEIFEKVGQTGVGTNYILRMGS